MKKFIDKVKSVFTKVKNFVKKHWKKATAAVGVAVISGVAFIAGVAEGTELGYETGVMEEHFMCTKEDLYVDDILANRSDADIDAWFHLCLYPPCE